MLVLLIQDNEAANEDWHSLKRGVGCSLSFWEVSCSHPRQDTKSAGSPQNTGEMSMMLVAFGNVDHDGFSLNKC